MVNSAVCNSSASADIAMSKGMGILSSCCWLSSDILMILDLWTLPGSPSCCMNSNELDRIYRDEEDTVTVAE